MSLIAKLYFCPLSHSTTNGTTHWEDCGPTVHFWRASLLLMPEEQPEAPGSTTSQQGHLLLPPQSRRTQQARLSDKGRPLCPSGPASTQVGAAADTERPQLQPKPEAQSRSKSELPQDPCPGGQKEEVLLGPKDGTQNQERAPRTPGSVFLPAGKPHQQQASTQVSADLQASRDWAVPSCMEPVIAGHHL